MFARWKLILRYVPRYRSTILGGLAALVGANALGAAAPVVVRKTIQAIERPWRAGTSIDLGAVAGSTGESG